MTIFFIVVLAFSLIILWMILDYQFIRLKSLLKECENQNNLLGNQCGYTNH